MGLVVERGADPAGRHVVGTWVAPSLRGTGLAARLLDTLAAHARADGAEQLTLWVMRGNTAALHAYQRYGFSQVEVPPQVQDHTCANEIRMAMSLA